MTQVNSITGSLQASFGTTPEVASVVIALVVSTIIFGGIHWISKVSEKVVPFMAAAYIFATVTIIFLHLDQLLPALKSVFSGAFTGTAAMGGFAGATVKMAIQKGVARGVFSNESGLGSAPIAAAAAKTNEPVEQGLISMTGTFIDTIIICTMTGLSIVITGAWDIGLEGVAVTTHAFQTGLPFAPQVSSFLLMACLVFFAFTTILGWNYYGERCLEYLANGKSAAVTPYRWLYILAVFIGPFMTVSAVWTIADIFNALMALPNLIAIIALSGVVVAETRAYFNRAEALNPMGLNTDPEEV